MLFKNNCNKGEILNSAQEKQGGKVLKSWGDLVKNYWTTLGDCWPMGEAICDLTINKVVP